MIDLIIDDDAGFSGEVVDLLKKCCERTLNAENYVENVEISLTFTDNNEIKSLNKQYRNIDRHTDVLSFPMNEKNPENGFIMLGDIVISTEQAKKQACEYGHGIERELAFLCTHSVLHLLGYDHDNNNEDEKIMREKQTSILNSLGLSVKSD